MTDQNGQEKHAGNDGLATGAIQKGGCCSADHYDSADHDWHRQMTARRYQILERYQ
jgi:hypothetical protein